MVGGRRVIRDSAGAAAGSREPGDRHEGRPDEDRVEAPPAPVTYDELRRQPRVRRRALRFADEDSFLKTLILLAELASAGPIQYHPVGGQGSRAMILSEWSYELLAPLLDEQKISYREVKVIPMSDLPPERQAQLRGLRD